MSEAKNIESSVEEQNVPLLRLHNFQPIKKEIQKNSVLIPGGASKRRSGPNSISAAPHGSQTTKGHFDVLEGLDNTSNPGDFEEQKYRTESKRGSDDSYHQHHRQHRQPAQRTISNHRGSPTRNVRKAPPAKAPSPTLGMKQASQSSLSSAFSLPVAANVTSISAGAQIFKVSKTKGIGPGQYDSIQTAIDDAPPFSVIRISPGIYLEPINITKPLKLIADPKYQDIIRVNKDAASNNTPTTFLNSHLDQQIQGAMSQTRGGGQSRLERGLQSDKVYILSSKGPAVTIDTSPLYEAPSPTQSGSKSSQKFVQLIGLRIGHIGPKQEGTQIIKLALAENACPDVFKEFDIIDDERIACGLWVRNGSVSLQESIISLSTVPITMNLKLSCLLAFCGTKIHLRKCTIRGHPYHPTAGIVSLNAELVKVEDTRIYQCPSGGILARGSFTERFELSDCKFRDCGIVGVYCLGQSEQEFKARTDQEEEARLRYDLKKIYKKQKQTTNQDLMDQYQPKLKDEVWQTERMENIFKIFILRCEFRQIEGDGLSTSWGVYGLVGGCKFDYCRVGIRVRLSNLKVFVNWIFRSLESGIVTEGVNSSQKYLPPSLRPCSQMMMITHKIFKFSPVIKFNKIEHSTAFGVLVLDYGNGTRINLNTSIGLNKKGGIKIDDRARAVIVENNICNNQGQGILITEGATAYIECNTLTGNKKANIAFGPPGKIFKPERLIGQKQINLQRCKTTEIWFNKISMSKSEGIFGVQSNQRATAQYKQQIGMGKPNKTAVKKIKRTQIDVAQLNDNDSILDHPSNAGLIGTPSPDPRGFTESPRFPIEDDTNNLKMFHQPAIIKRNQIFDNHDGIVLTNYSAKILDNEIFQNTRSGIILSGMAKPVILENSIRKNTTCGIIFRNGLNGERVGYIQQNKILENYFQISVTKRQARQVKDIKAHNYIDGLCEVPSKACAIF